MLIVFDEPEDLGGVNTRNTVFVENAKIISESNNEGKLMMV